MNEFSLITHSIQSGWMEFYNSGFRRWPMKQWRNGKVYYKTNQAKWAKQ